MKGSGQPLTGRLALVVMAAGVATVSDEQTGDSAGKPLPIRQSDVRPRRGDIAPSPAAH
jgi:hypothetical protein